jgi:hypothetical protein
MAHGVGQTSKRSARREPASWSSIPGGYGHGSTGCQREAPGVNRALAALIILARRASGVRRALTADRGAALPRIPNKHRKTFRAILGGVNGRSALTPVALSTV